MHDDHPAIPDDPGSDGDIDGPHRGWLSPDDRLWRHPSEPATSGSPSAGPGGSPPGVGSPAPAHHPARRSSSRIRQVLIGVGTVGATVSLMVVGFVVAAANAPSQQAASTSRPSTAGLTTPTTTPGSPQLSGITHLSSVATAASASIVALDVTTRQGRHFGVGLVIAAGGVVAAPMGLLAGAQQVIAIEPNGTRAAAVILGTDHTSGIAALHVVDDLPTAPVATRLPDPGATGVVVSMTASPRTDTGVTLSAATVVEQPSSAAPVSDPTEGGRFSMTTAVAPTSVRQVGDPLVTASGEVAGLLVSTQPQPGGGVSATFVPAALAQSVVDRMILDGSVTTGVLGATVSDAPGSTGWRGAGAMILTVDHGGGADSAGLMAGDVVTAVDGYQVRTVADLRTYLYGDAPGTACSVDIVRDGLSANTTVVLGS